MGRRPTGEDAKTIFSVKWFFPSGEDQIRHTKNILWEQLSLPFHAIKLHISNVTLNLVVVKKLAYPQKPRKAADRYYRHSRTRLVSKKAKRCRNSAGPIIHILPTVKHWHGQQPTVGFAHLAFEVPGEKTNRWLEAVTDESIINLNRINVMTSTTSVLFSLMYLQKDWRS